MKNKTLEICDLISNERFDFLALTETWLIDFDNAAIQEMAPISHTFLHQSRKDKCGGGGVGLFLSNSFEKIKMYPNERMNSFESLKVGCELKGKKCTFIVIYRPPNLSVTEFIEDFGSYLELLDMVTANTFICGDFNLWIDDHRTRGVDMMDSFNLVNMVKSQPYLEITFWT